MAQTTSQRRSPATWVAASILVLIAIVGTAWVPIYARSTPTLGGFPFFYWFQLIWVPAVAILCLLAYLLLRTKPQDRASAAAAVGGQGAASNQGTGSGQGAGGNQSPGGNHATGGNQGTATNQKAPRQ
jgi:cytochrome bd-type quinol oxidase subunit 2